MLLARIVEAGEEEFRLRLILRSTWYLAIGAAHRANVPFGLITCIQRAHHSAALVQVTPSVAQRRQGSAA